MLLVAGIMQLVAKREMLLVLLDILIGIGTPAALMSANRPLPLHHHRRLLLVTQILLVPMANPVPLPVAKLELNLVQE